MGCGVCVCVTSITPKLPPMDINLRVPTLQELEVTIVTRKDIPFHIARAPNLLFAPKRQTVRSFHKKLTSGKMFLVLKELWHLTKRKDAREFATYCLHANNRNQDGKINIYVTF